MMNLQFYQPFSKSNIMIKNLSQGDSKAWNHQKLDSLTSKLKYRSSAKQKMFSRNQANIYKCYSPQKKTRKNDFNLKQQYYEPLIIKDFQDGQKVTSIKRQNSHIQLAKSTQKVQEKVLFRTKVIRIIQKNNQQLFENKKIGQNSKRSLQYEFSKSTAYDHDNKQRYQSAANPQSIQFNMLLNRINQNKKSQSSEINLIIAKQEPKRDDMVVKKYQSQQIYEKIRKDFKINEKCQSSIDKNVKTNKQTGATNCDESNFDKIINFKSGLDGIFKVKSQKIMLKPFKSKAKQMNGYGMTMKIRLNKFCKDEIIEGW